MEMVKLKGPESLREEHEAFIDGLKSRSTSKGETGAALGRLLKLLEPHVEREDELVLPLLGALHGVAAGLPLESSGAVMRLYERYAGQYGNMFAEHLPIRQALKSAKAAARKEGRDDVVEILDALAHHSRVEEEVLYPAALLIGKAASPRTIRVGGRGSTKAPSAAAPGDIEPTGGLSYFALDYDAPMSQVRKDLMLMHHDILETLSQVDDLVKKGKPGVAISLLNVATPLILRAAVEEEARVMRVVMAKNKSRSQRSVAIARQHREIVDFLKHRLPDLGSKPPDEARRSIVAFVRLTRRHLREEEEVPFSIAAAGQQR